MKLLFLIGSGAVGKMTVGQELMKITDMRLFHNHMSIELVLSVFGGLNKEADRRIRQAIFEEFAASGAYGLIFTYMWDFDSEGDWDYIESVKKIFEKHGAEFYCAELVAPLEVRLARNGTENRLKNKASKRNQEFSRSLILNEEKYRLISHDGEVPFENYIKIDNSDLSPEETARIIKQKFSL